ncbi:OLC1v1012884C2 [Oldenlandia corymbosa var. corymbosa]|uniref:OLC1v1012884C2 n=1 Tax=Oldenlandia corymbosa var. corymbosa TaxID=529605 RepID=A0AAV1DWX7_OLDCO|nr:OLC1v1012884C2 [Oldenlandia corymbosa var. corymbosa]
MFDLLQATWMALKVDLQCPCCYKKIKKILCKFHEVKDQVYDEQKNLVKITVVACSPERIREKLCSKGKKVIQSIEIIKPPEPSTKKETGTEKKEADGDKKGKKPKDGTTNRPNAPEERNVHIEIQLRDPTQPCKPAAPHPNPPCPAPAPPATPVEAVPVPVRVVPVPPGYFIPRSRCDCGSPYRPCSCEYGNFRPLPPPLPQPCFDNHCGYGSGCNRGCCINRCDYVWDENASGCTIM